MLHARERARRERVHEVTITADSRLARAVGNGVIRVNTLHHQAVDRVAPTLRVTATAPDAVIEAAETVDERWWVLGVQWHPEELIDTPEPWDRAIFAAFASACQR
jgi:putative glutamine amidotransferase